MELLATNISNMQPVFLDLAFGAALAVFLVLEMIRVSQISITYLS